MQGVVNKLFVFKSLLTVPSNVLPLNLKQTLLPIIWIYTEGDGIKSRLPLKSFLLYGLYLIMHYCAYLFLTTVIFKTFRDLDSNFKINFQVWRRCWFSIFSNLLFQEADATWRRCPFTWSSKPLVYLELATIPIQMAFTSQSSFVRISRIGHGHVALQ